MTRSLFVSGALLLGSGCADPPNLGRIAAQPNCAGLDRACLEEGFGAPLAVGASVELQLDVWTAPSTTPPLTLRAATDAIEVQGHRVAALDEGVTSILILDPAGEVLDVLHIWTQDGDAVSLRAVDRNTPGEISSALSMAVGDTLDFSVVLERDGYDLMGTPPVTLDVEGSSVSAGPGPIDGTLRVRAEAAGSARVSVISGELSATLDVEVQA